MFFDLNFDILFFVLVEKTKFPLWEEFNFNFLFVNCYEKKVAEIYNDKEVFFLKRSNKYYHFMKMTEAVADINFLIILKMPKYSYNNNIKTILFNMRDCYYTLIGILNSFELNSNNTLAFKNYEKLRKYIERYFNFWIITINFLLCFQFSSSLF